MYQFILLIHVFAAISIIGLVLVQQGKGATMGAAFGSGASQTVFGSRGSGSFLFRLTISFIAVFFLTSIALNYIVVRSYKQEKIVTLPFVPAKHTQTKPAATPVTTNNLQDQIPVTTLPVPVAEPSTNEVNTQKVPAAHSETHSEPGRTAATSSKKQ